MRGKKQGDTDDRNPLRRCIRETLMIIDRPMSVGELAELFEIRFPLMNYHLRVLHRANTVQLAHTKSVGRSLTAFYERASAA